MDQWATLSGPRGTIRLVSIPESPLRKQLIPLVGVIAVIALSAMLFSRFQKKAEPEKTKGVSQKTRTRPLSDGFTDVPELSICGILPGGTRPNFLKRVGPPIRDIGPDGWEDFGAVQVLWNEDESIWQMKAMKGQKLFSREQLVASVGSRFEDVMAKFGLPQKIGSGKLPGQKILDYQGNCIRITALAQGDESMEDWKFQDVCWGFVNVPEK